MFVRQALRYRWSQTLVLAGISLLIGTCAVFGPWFARAVQQTVMTETLSGQRLSAAWQLETSPARSSASNPQPEDLTKLVPADIGPLFTKPVLGIHSDVNWRDSPERSSVACCGGTGTAPRSSWSPAGARADRTK